MQATNQDFPFYGTVSHGTMRNEDLIPCFAEVLFAIPKGTAHFGGLICDANTLTDYGSEEAYDILNMLFDALNYFAPEGYYFGAHPGDGSDFGFWQVDCDE